MKPFDGLDEKVAEDVDVSQIELPSDVAFDDEKAPAFLCLYFNQALK